MEDSNGLYCKFHENKQVDKANKQIKKKSLIIIAL